MSFAQMNLHPQIFKAIEACGYTIPTPIQAKSIPDILNGRDLVASAQTGTGKTAAFVLPALHKLSLSKSTVKPRILILTPTRELATQITEAANKYGKFMKFNIISLVGGMPYRQQLRDLSRPVDIIVATPGRLLDHMDNRRLDLSAIEMLVLDEADRMLDMGFIDDVRDIAKKTPETRQTLLFSATVDSKLSSVIRSLLKEPVRIDLSEEKMAPSKIKQKLYLTDNAQHKMRLLQHFLNNENIFKAIIFSATKINADQLANQLRDQGFEAAALHGDLKQNVRTRTVEQLRRGKIQFLVATDVAARGIDISDVTHVINYDLPKFSEDYVHRIGRTGRAGKTGIAISFALPMDARHLQKIERYIGQRFELETIEGLEPTKKMGSTSASAGDSRKRQGKGGSGGYRKKEPRGSYARTDDSRKSEGRGGYAKSSKPRHSDDTRGSYAKSSPRDGERKSSYAKTDSARNNNDRSSYAKTRSRDGEGRSSYAKTDSTRSSEGRGGYAKTRSRDGEGRSSYAKADSTRSSEGRGSYAKTRSRDDEGRSSYAKADSTRSSEGRGSYAKTRSRDGEGRSSYAKADSTRSSEGRGSYAKTRSRDGEGRSSYAKTDSARNSEGRGSYAKTRSRDSEGRSSYAKADNTRSSEGRGSYAKTRSRDGEGRGNYAKADGARNSEGRGSYAKTRSKDSEGRSTYAKTDNTKKSEGRFAKTTHTKSDDSRISYGKTKGPRDTDDRGFKKRKKTRRD